MAKLQKIIFILLLIFLPSQLGLHFWPEWSYINGVRIDYFSPTIYFTDILVFLLFLLQMINVQLPIFNEHSIKKFPIGKFIGLLVVGLLVVSNIYYSHAPLISFYKWLKVAELVFLVWYVAKNLHHSVKLEHVTVILLIPIVYSCLLAVWQFVNQGSVGGIWYLLGERSFTVNTPGIANAVINGQFVLRPYATFPHPNVLAGFLVVAGSLVIINLTHNSRKITALLLVLLTSICFLTLSKGNLITGWNLRQQLNKIAAQQWLKSPLVGTGLGTSPLYERNISNFAMLHQPIHNIYLLVLSETGIVGFGLFTFLIIKAFRNSLIIERWKLIVPLIAIMGLGMFDHYWLTLQQPQLLFALTLGIMLRK